MPRASSHSVGPDRKAAREAGSVLITTAGALAMLLVCGALAVDIGRLAHARRLLQLQVDAAALAAARKVGACAAEPTDPVPTVQAVAAANGFDGDLSAPPNAVSLGRIETFGGLRQFVETGDLASATAVEVTAWQSLPLSLLASFYLPGEKELRATGAARASALAGIRAGSFLARAAVDPDDAAIGNDLLSAELGGPVMLSVLDYSTLAAAGVQLGDLVDAFASVGSVDELLATEVGVGELLSIVADALASQGEDSAAASLNDVTLATDPARSVRIGDFLDVATQDEAALDASLNALDLLALSAQAANGDNAVRINPLTAAVPGVSTASLTLVVVEPAQMAIGPPGMDEDGAWRTQVRTAQTRVQLDLELLASSPLLSSPALQLSVFFEAAPTNAHLSAVKCASAGDRVDRPIVTAQPGIFRFGVGRFSDPLASGGTDPAPIADLSVFGLTVARVSAFTEQGLLGSATDLEFEGPFPPAAPASPGHTQTVDTDLVTAGAEFAQGAADEVVVTAEILGGLPLGVGAADIQDAIANVLEPVLAATGPLLTSVLSSSGAHVGGADVGVTSLTVERPRLMR